MTRIPNETAASLDSLVSAYDFDLPEELIAQRPASGLDRASSRLLIYRQNDHSVTHDFFYNIGKYLPKDTTLVFNQSKVFPSRLKGSKTSGGKAEVFFLSAVPDSEGLYQALIKTRSRKSPGDKFLFSEAMSVQVEKIFSDGTFGISVVLPSAYNHLMDFLEQHALIPIPPYIRKGESDELDKLQYQTVYSKEVGSVAAPTAGLHFTRELMNQLREEGIKEAYVTLHVGLGTFRPVSVEDIHQHTMHDESYFIDEKNLQRIRSAQKTIAVGTTSLRVLESSLKTKNFKASQIHQTSIFLHPGVEVESVQGLITNFHLPKSTLLMLVSALIGREKALELYALAIKEKYRFFSYGDAMLILR